VTAARASLTLERTFDASLADVWELWTTMDGLESWWGPEGFSVTVHELALRVGGALRYTMTATGAEQVAFLKKAGVPLVTESRVRYREVVPRKRLAFVQLADFVPGVAPYDIETVVELTARDGGVHMRLTFDAMHDARWTDLARRGHESQLGKLARVLEARRASANDPAR
jgi:uncharacterized protein YndB with AHSA1/START domain